MSNPDSHIVAHVRALGVRRTRASGVACSIDALVGADELASLAPIVHHVVDPVAGVLAVRGNDSALGLGAEVGVAVGSLSASA